MNMRYIIIRAGAAALASASLVAGISVNLTDSNSVKSAASTIAWNMVQYYPGNQTGMTPGTLNPPYYWWEAGAMFGTLIDYWYYTGDDSYNDIITQGMLFQTGPNYDYMPPNQTRDEGNDDQMFWAFSAMSAAEYKFPDPPEGTPGWLALAEAVFNSQALRWDTTYCAGGLRWQIFTWNSGYNYKNSPSNAGLMNLAARLYAYTGNKTFADWVEKEWDWMTAVGLITDVYNVFDGVVTDNNCTSVDEIQWTYSSGMMINVAAVMANVTNSTLWATRAHGFWKQAQGIFFDTQTKIMFESACENQNNCDTDQLSFKAHFTRFLTASSKWMPSLWAEVQPYLVVSAQAAAMQCDGGSTGTMCGFQWQKLSTWDGSSGIGQEMCALEIIMATLIHTAPAPVTAKKGGTSKGNTSLGTEGDSADTVVATLPAISIRDQAGAGALTGVVLVIFLSTMLWIV